MNEFGFGAAGSSAAETPGATTMTMEADWTQSDSLVQAAPSAEVATGAVEEPPDNNTYRFDLNCVAYTTSSRSNLF